MNKIVIMRGIPGSGKTYNGLLLKESLETRGYTAELYAADDLFMQDGEYKPDLKRLSEAHQICLQRTMSAVSRGIIPIVHNTHTRLWEYEALIRLAVLVGYSVEINEISVQTRQDFDICVQRGKVDRDVVAKMWGRFEPAPLALLLATFKSLRSLHVNTLDVHGDPITTG